MATIPITKRGAEKLKAELHRLKTLDRPQVIAAIAEARSHGDLSENAEYEAAKDRQGFIEGRIQEVEGKLFRRYFEEDKLGWASTGARQSGCHSRNPGQSGERSPSHPG